MATAYLTEEEVFGTSRPRPATRAPVYLTNEEVFGTPKPAAPPAEYKVPPAVQAERDREALAIREAERQSQVAAGKAEDAAATARDIARLKAQQPQPQVPPQAPPVVPPQAPPVAARPPVVPPQAPPVTPAAPAALGSTMGDEFTSGLILPTPDAPPQAPPRGTAFFQELAKGAERAATVDLPSMWEQAGVIKDVGVLSTLQQRLDLFNRIERGEITSPDQLRGLDMTTGQARSYLASPPEIREKLRERALGEVSRRTDFVKAAIETVKAYQKDAQRLKPRVEKASQIGSLQDFVDWLGSNVGSGAVQMAPMILAAATTGGVGLVGISSAMGVSEAVGERLKFIQEQNEKLPPEQRAAATIKYLQDTGDVTLLTGVVSGLLDAALGPEAAFVKQQAKKLLQATTRKEAVKQAAKKVPGQILGEGITGGGQQAVQTAGAVKLGEKPEFFTPQTLVDVLDAAAAEAAGATAGSALNVGMAALPSREAPTEPEAPPTRVEPGAELPATAPSDTAPPMGRARKTAEAFDRTVPKMGKATVEEPEGRVEPTYVSEEEVFGGEAPTREEPELGEVETTAEVEAPAAPAAPVLPTAELTEANVRQSDEYAQRFQKYRKLGMTKEDSDALARREILGMEHGLERLPPLGNWEVPMLLGTWQTQMGKPTPSRNEPLVVGLENELAKRGMDVPRLKTLMDEQIDTGLPPDQAAATAITRLQEETGFDEEAAVEGEGRVRQTVGAPSGAGVGVAGEPSAGPPTGRPVGAEPTGVVPPVTPAGEPAVGEGAQPRAVTETAEQRSKRIDEEEAKAIADEAAFQKKVDEAKSDARHHARTAHDQRREYSDLDEAFDSHRQNFVDTLREQGVTDPFVTESALREFDAEAGRIKTEGAAPTTPKTTTAEAPAAKRGRPKLELTPEQQAEKEAQTKAARAAYTKADRQAKAAVAMLDRLQQPLDESQFDTEEALAEARKDRDAQRRSTIRTLLQMEPNFRGTALGKRIKQALNRPDVSEKEKADILEGIKRLATYAKDTVLPSKAPASEKVNPALFKVKNAAQALTVIANTGTRFQKLIANRLRRFVVNVPVIVVEKGDPTPEALRSGRAAEAWEGARGLFFENATDGSRVIYLRGASFGRDQGVNNVTTLHEILHAATNQKLYLGLRGLLNNLWGGSDIVKFAREITQIMDRVDRIYAVLDEEGAIPTELADLVESTLRFDKNGKPSYEIFTDHNEFLAYGMSHPVFQDFLAAIPDTERQPIYKRFVNAIRDALGIPVGDTSALSNLVNATEHVLSARKTFGMLRLEAGERQMAREAGVDMSKVSAANKQKAKKLNRFERKIQRSEDAQEIVDDIGNMTSLRNPREFLDLLSGVWQAFSVKKLQVLPPALQTDTIVQWAGRLGVNGLDRAWRGMQDMGAMRANMLSAAADNTREWLKLHPGVTGAMRQRATGQRSEMTKLAAVMHYATDAGIDPDVSSKDPKLAKMWEDLSGKAKDVYRNIRDSYKAYFDLYRLLLDQRIANLNVPGNISDPDTPKGRIMAEIKKMYETGQAISPYFPLMRYGDYWLRIGKGKGQEFYMFEGVVERERFLKRRLRENESAGLPEPEVEKGNSMRELRNRSASADTSELLKDIFDAIDQTGAFDSKEDLKDQIYQLYLTTMPEQTFRTQFVHRKGTTGYSGDALRNYIASSMNMANQLSRLKYGPRVLDDVKAARSSLEGNPDKDKLEMLVDEFGQRAEMEIFPSPESKIANTAANIANRSAFLYFMTSVKTALSQFASLPIFGVPVLASRHNPAKVALEMGRFMNVFNQLGVIKKNDDGTISFTAPTISESRAVKLSPDEQQAIEAMEDRGLADVTLTYDLMDRRSTPTTKYIGAWKTGTNVMGALFHHVERLNREVMYLTSFRLTMDELKQRGITGQAAVELAIEQAVNDTYTALGNFTEGNRPRVMRGPLGRTVLQFKTFPAFVTTYFVRNFYRMLPYLNAEGKREAATQFFGTLGMSYLLAGYVGIPGISFAIGTVQALINQFRDDEDEDPLEKKDLYTWLRNVYIPQMFGEVKIGDTPVSEIADAGVLNSISGYDMNSSLSMNNMWFPELKEGPTYQGEAQDYAFALAGPFASLTLNQIPSAMDDFRAGKFERGVEKMMPNLIRQPLTAYRYSKEGATTPAGDVIKSAEDFTTGQLVMQALGYRTEGLADVQTANFKANAIRRSVMNEKNRIVARFDKEATEGSDAEFDKALDGVLNFNSRYPMLAIKGDQFSEMVINRMEARAKADRGFRVDKKFYPYLQELLESSRQKIEREEAKK